MSQQLDPQLAALLAAAAPQPFRALGPAAARTRTRELRSSMPPGPGVSLLEDVTVSAGGHTISARRYEPATAIADAPLVVYFHGGGWVVGGLDESDTFCRVLANAAAAEVLSVDYRLAPEHPFPAAVHDADTALTWAANSLLRPGAPLIVAGDSAGGNLAAVVARRARDRGGPAIALQILVYPVTDARMTTGSYAEHGAQLLISADDMAWFWDQYAPNPADRLNPDASPLLADDLSGLPPALVLVAEHDPLRDEVLEYAEQLRTAGVAVDTVRYATAAHGFFALPGLLHQADSAIGAVAAVIAGLNPDANESRRGVREPH
jgi:acetyl esterase